MTDPHQLAQAFEANRTHLRAVAYRMLGSINEADDAVQEAWFRLIRSDAASIDNLAGWLTTVVSRVCLDLLRSRTARREDPVADDVHTDSHDVTAVDPEHDAVMADSVGAALLVVLDTLTPAERLAFVLHDMFAVPFEEIATIVERTPDAARQLASRARRRVQGASASGEADPARQRAVINAFLAASRNGDFEALVALLDPDVVLEADAAAVKMGSPATTRGAAAVANTFSGRALAAQPAEIGDGFGLVWIAGGSTRVAWEFTITDGKVTHIDMLAAADTLDSLDLTVLEIQD